MNEKVTSKNNEINDPTLNSKESQYSNLINRLKEIKSYITLLEKKISK